MGDINNVEEMKENYEDQNNKKGTYHIVKSIKKSFFNINAKLSDLNELR